jgi:hypothetical protein
VSENNPRLRALGERLAHEQDEILARTPDRAVFRGARAKRKRPTLWLAAAPAAIAIAAGIALLIGRARPLGVTVGGERNMEGRWIAAPHDAQIPIRFSEGTEVILEPEAHARVLDVTRSGAHVMLESGTARVSVTPDRGGRWTFTAGPFTVDVKGTRFALAWSPTEESLTLTLVEGSVVVSGCAVGDGRPLYAGETLSASCVRNEFHIDRAAATPAPPPPNEPPETSETSEESAPPATAIDPIDPASRPASRSAAPEESWQSLARASRFKEAFARVDERGFDAELMRAGAADLVLLGDVARLSGDPARALVAYERVRSRAPGTEAAANAAFSMGRVYFDQREAYPEAARWFATYRSERSHGPLARDAMGRQMEALARAGDRATAARIADEYLVIYPQGPHAPFARNFRLVAH